MAEPGEGLNINEALNGGSFRAEKLPAAFGEMIDLAAERGSSLIITRHGKMAAYVVPMTAPQAVARYLEMNPEEAAKLRTTIEGIRSGEIETISAAEVLGEMGDQTPSGE